MDYYVVLGIAEDADEETIRSAFRALARCYHPDVGAGSSPVQFQRAREAYETLVDPERRRRYDRQLRASRAQPPVAVEELTVAMPFAEPLSGWRRADFDMPATLRVSSLFDEILEEFFGFVDDDWFRVRRRWR